MKTNHHFLSNWVTDCLLKSLAQKYCLEPDALFNEFFILHVFQINIIYTIYLQWHFIYLNKNMIIDMQQLCKFHVGDCGVLEIDVSGCGILCWCLWGLMNGCVSGRYRLTGRNRLTTVLSPSTAFSSKIYLTSFSKS